MKEGTKVWLRGAYAKDFTVRGIVEAVRDGHRIGIRLENGNFKWALKTDVIERRDQDEMRRRRA